MGALRFQDLNFERTQTFRVQQEHLPDDAGGDWDIRSPASFTVIEHSYHLSISAFWGRKALQVILWHYWILNLIRMAIILWLVSISRRPVISIFCYKMSYVIRKVRHPYKKGKLKEPNYCEVQTFHKSASHAMYFCVIHFMTVAWGG